MQTSSSSEGKRRVAIAIRNLVNNSGAARNVREQCRMLSELGFDVDLYAERIDIERVHPSDARVHRVRPWPVPRRYRRRLFDVRVRQHMRNRPGTPLISHGDVRTRDALFMHNCVHLAHELTIGTELPDSDPLGRLHRQLITEAELALLVANSRLMADDFVHRFGIDPERVAVIYQGYSPEIFNTNDKVLQRKRGRARLGLGDDIRLAGLVTSGDFRKRNVAGLLRAARATVRDIHWLIVGKDRRQHEYEALACELGIADRVHFRPVVNEVERYYHALDLFVLPAHIEEFGRSALEAMACATPVVLGPRVGCAETLEGRARQGLLKNVDPEHIARTVDGMFSDPTALQETARECAQIAPEYREQRQAERLLELLHSRFPGRFPGGDT